MEEDTIQPLDYNSSRNGTTLCENEFPPETEYSLEHPTLFPSKTLLELCNSSWNRSPDSSINVQPFLRGCKWSPDGTCCLSVVNHDGVHVLELPTDLYNGSVTSDRMIDVIDSVVHVKEAGLIYDFCWYPGMKSTVPETCCWITTRQNGPIQMWDAFDGSLRCSYRGFNSVDEMEPAVTVTFNPEGDRIIAGYKRFLRSFDVERPGRDFCEHKITSPASCLATERNLLAVGSWNTTISLYNINEMGYKSIGKMRGHSGGITHIKFTPDGLKLVSGARKDHRLLVWDIRFFKRPLNILNRVIKTNQRIYFDISPCGRYLISGGTDGVIKVWDQDVAWWTDALDVTDIQEDNATFKFPLHKDCCNSISIHPIRPIIATGSGQYHLVDPIKVLEDANENQNESVTQNLSATKDVSLSSKDNEMLYSSHTENNVVFWWVGDVPGVT